MALGTKPIVLDEIEQPAASGPPVADRVELRLLGAIVVQSFRDRDLLADSKHTFHEEVKARGREIAREWTAKLGEAKLRRLRARRRNELLGRILAAVPTEPAGARGTRLLAAL